MFTKPIICIVSVIALTSCAEVSDVASANQSPNLKQSTTPHRILKGIVSDEFTVTSVRNEIITIQMTWWDRLGTTKETIAVKNLQLSKASVSYENTGPFNGLYELTIPCSQSHLFHRWATHKGKTTKRIADESKSVNSLVLYTKNKDGAHNVIKTFKAMQSGSKPSQVKPSSNTSQKYPVPSVATQRKKLESQDEKVGLFYIKHVKKPSKPVWNSNYISPMDQGLSYDAAYNVILKTAQSKLDSLNSGTSGNPYYIQVGGY